MLFHRVCGVIQDQRVERVKLVRRGKTKPPAWVSEDGNSLELAPITGGTKEETEREKEVYARPLQLDYR